MKPTVMCITRSKLAELFSKDVYESNFSKLLKLSGNFYDHFQSDDFLFIPRKYADNVEKAIEFSKYPQILGYSVLKNGEKYATYSRTKNAGEVRLHGNMSLGFGGHIDLSDIFLEEESPHLIDYSTTIYNSVSRELYEEVGLSISPEHGKIIGLIVDNYNDVGKVHTGIVYLFDLFDISEVSENASELENIQWMTKEELHNNLQYFENWSKIIINNIDQF